MQTNSDVHLVIESNQYRNELPILLNTGTVDIKIKPRAIDFGIFHHKKPPTDVYLEVTNTGSATTRFRLRRSELICEINLPYKLSQWEGNLVPGGTCTIRASFCGSIGQFKENLYIETEKRGFSEVFCCSWYMYARPIFSAISEKEGFEFGTCTVGKESTATYAITNKVFLI